MKPSAALGLAMGAAMILPSGARSEDAGAIDRFLDFASNGCVQSVVSGAPLKAFAALRGAQPADRAVAGTVLGTEAGAVYLKDDPNYPLVLAERPDGPCTVNARFPGDLAAMIAAVEDFFAGPGGGFHKVRAFEEQAAPGGWATHRIYVGKRRGKNLSLLFSTTPQAGTLDQVMIAVVDTKQ